MKMILHRPTIPLESQDSLGIFFFFMACSFCHKKYVSALFPSVWLFSGFYMHISIFPWSRTSFPQVCCYPYFLHFLPSMSFLQHVKILPFSLIILCIFEKFFDNILLLFMISFECREIISLLCIYISKSPFCVYIASDVTIHPKKADMWEIFLLLFFHLFSCQAWHARELSRFHSHRARTYAQAADFPPGGFVFHKASFHLLPDVSVKASFAADLIYALFFLIFCCFSHVFWMTHIIACSPSCASQCASACAYVATTGNRFGQFNCFLSHGSLSFIQSTTPVIVHFPAIFLRESTVNKSEKGYRFSYTFHPSYTFSKVVKMEISYLSSSCFCSWFLFSNVIQFISINSRFLLFLEYSRNWLLFFFLGLSGELNSPGATPAHACDMCPIGASKRTETSPDVHQRRQQQVCSLRTMCRILCYAYLW